MKKKPIKIYTSYFAKLNQLPQDVVPVAICGKSPEWYKGLEYKVLAPKWWFYNEYKNGRMSSDEYTHYFHKEVLSRIDPKKIVDAILEKTEGKTPALICYEKVGDFCHRHLVADWLNEAGFDCTEYIEE